MAYLEAWSVWAGALDKECTFRDANVSYDRWARREIAAGRKVGEDVEVYSIFHDHDEGVDCECVQYLTDHHPDYSTDA